MTPEEIETLNKLHSEMKEISDKYQHLYVSFSNLNDVLLKVQGEFFGYVCKITNVLNQPAIEANELQKEKDFLNKISESKTQTIVEGL